MKGSDEVNFKKRIYIAISILVPLLIGITLGIWQVQPQRANGDSPVFQSMMHNIERLAQSPRHTGTPDAFIELKRVRSEIIAEIESMGLEPIIHDVSLFRMEVTEIRQLLGRRALYRRYFHDQFLPLQNILVRLESQTSDRVVMIVSHYDSAFNSPGAADAMLPVAAMLEAMRIHAGNENLANNIYFLITDGEEIGALGAYAFIRERPDLANRIDMLVNLDARGTSGGLILFETTPQPRSMLKLWNRAVSRPIGFSLAQPIYEYLNYFSDFCFFSMYNWRGVNLAIVQGGEHYHTPTDDFTHLNRNTAWHYLTTVLEFVDYAANNSLYGLHDNSSNAIFFMLLPGNMVVISYTWAYILCGLAVLLALAYFIIQIKNKRLKMSQSTVALLVLTILSIISALLFHVGSYCFGCHFYLR